MSIHASARPKVLNGLLPGLLASAAMALLAFSIGYLPGAAYLSPMIVAILIGMAVANLGHVPGGWAPGLGFAVRPLLRTAIVLLGLRVTLGDLMALGWVVSLPWCRPSFSPMSSRSGSVGSWGCPNVYRRSLRPEPRSVVRPPWLP